MRKKNLKIIFIIAILLLISIYTAKHVYSKTDKIKNNTINEMQYYDMSKIFEKPKITIKTEVPDVKIKYTEDDLYWLAKIVYAEAQEDVDEGQQAVANVVMNRVDSEEYPNSIYEVIWQKTGKLYQFSPCADGGIKREPNERAIKNAKIVLEGKRLLPKNVLYFYMPTKGNRYDWIRSRKIYKKIGVHRFCF